MTDLFALFFFHSPCMTWLISIGFFDIEYMYCGMITGDTEKSGILIKIDTIDRGMLSSTS